MEAVAATERELAICFRVACIVSWKSWLSFACNARSEWPTLTLKFSLIPVGAMDVYLLRAGHLPVAHEASVANGRRRDVVSVSVRIPSM